MRSASASESTGVIRASTPAGSGPPFSCSFAEAPLDRLEPTLDRSRQRVVQQHLPAGGGDDLRDAGAHLAGADDENPLERHRSSLPRAASSAWRWRSRRIEYASTRARMRRPIDDLDRVAARLVARREQRAGVGQEHGSVVELRAVERREDAERLVVHDRLVRRVDEPLTADRTSTSLPDRALDVLVDDEAVDVARRSQRRARR